MIFLKIAIKNGIKNPETQKSIKKLNATPSIQPFTLLTYIEQNIKQ